MVRTKTRRAFVATVASGLAATAGCASLPFGDDGSGDSGGSAPAASDWPMRRGTAGNAGVSASGGPPSDASPAFTATLQDGYTTGQRAPVVGNDAIYALGQSRDPYSEDPPRAALRAYALSRDGGGERWATVLQEVTGEAVASFGGGHAACLGPDGLYAVWVSPADGGWQLRVARLSTADGSEQWRRTLSGGGTTMTQPVVRDGTLYAVSRGRVHALSTADGSTQWRSKTFVIGQPVVTAGERGVVLYHAERGDRPRGVTVLDPADGTVRWTTGLPNGRYQLPTVAGDTVFVADGGPYGQYGVGRLEDDSLPRRKIRALSMADGSTRWTHTYDTDAVRDALLPGGTGSVTVTADHVYYALGTVPPAAAVDNAGEDTVGEWREKVYSGPNVVALDRSDGSVVWRTTVGEFPQVYRPMVAGPDHLYALHPGIRHGDNDPRVHVVDRASGGVRGSFGPVEPRWALAVADGTAFVHEHTGIRVWK